MSFVILLQSLFEVKTQLSIHPHIRDLDHLNEVGGEEACDSIQLALPPTRRVGLVQHADDVSLRKRQIIWRFSSVVIECSALRTCCRMRVRKGKRVREGGMVHPNLLVLVPDTLRHHSRLLEAASNPLLSLQGSTHRRLRTVLHPQWAAGRDLQLQCTAPGRDLQPQCIAPDRVLQPPVLGRRREVVLLQAVQLSGEVQRSSEAQKMAEG